MNLTKSRNIEIKNKNLEIMKTRIVHLEKNNMKTKALTETQIIEEIRTIIVEEANKKY